MKKSISSRYTGKPVCAVHLARQFDERWKLLRAQWARDKVAAVKSWKGAA
jgi:hypothetical protein